ncbi:MAG: BLUF domain-containing protein [Erythrobacter sp.]|nr:BLUF domain-containing protein [Erythrobacter sp.]
MRRIIYQSTASAGMDRAELFRLVYHARVANDRKGLSGFLLFVDQRFLQVLEGEAWTLMATFDQIRRDVRHCDVKVIDERSIPAAKFAAWRMHCFAEQEVAGALEKMTIAASGPVPDYVTEAVQAFFSDDCVKADRLLLHPE